GLQRKWGYSRLTFSDFDLKPGIIEGARDSVTGLFTKHLLASDGTDSATIATDDDLKTYNHTMIIHQHVRHYKTVLDNGLALGNGRLNVRLAWQQNHREEANDIT